MTIPERFSTVIVGGGQAGLAAAHVLSRAQDDYLILEAGPGFGHAWRSRWDSLRLFTPAKFNSLPGMPFPGSDFDFPAKDEAAAYVEAYAQRLNPPVRFRTKVESLTFDDEGFSLEADGRRYVASQVIVATGAYHTPSIPPFAAQLDPKVVQFHSSMYRNPDSLPHGAVLVVGAGNSGAEIAVELAKAGREVWLSGRDVGRIPADRLGKVLGGRPYWFVISRVLSIHTPIGRRVRKASMVHGTPLIGLRPSAIVEAGVRRVPRLAGMTLGMPTLSDGRRFAVAGVVWATGYRPDFRWIRLPIFDEQGYPRHKRGVVPEVPGLYFLGLPFQTSLSSSLLGGVGADASFLARHLTRMPRRMSAMASIPA